MRFGKFQVTVKKDDVLLMLALAALLQSILVFGIFLIVIKGGR